MDFAVYEAHLMAGVAAGAYVTDPHLPLVRKHVLAETSCREQALPADQLLPSLAQSAVLNIRAGIE